MLSISAPVDAGIDGVANVDRIAVHLNCNGDGFHTSCSGRNNHRIQ